METKMRFLPVLMLILLPFLCFAQTEVPAAPLEPIPAPVANESVNEEERSSEDFVNIRINMSWEEWKARHGGGEQDSSEIAQMLVQEEVEKHLEEEGSFYILTDDADNQFIIQEFRWEASEYVYMYHFTVERMDENGDFILYNEQDVEENFADCRLVAGEYRYKIGLYNFLGILELETDWFPVTVKKAIKPVITNVSPDYLYVDTEDENIMTVKGNDLSESVSFKLINTETGLELPVIVVDKDIAKNVFDVQVAGLDLEPGSYMISARNEGGLTFSYSPITFAMSRPVDFCISIRRSWSIQIGRNVIDDYWTWNDCTSHSSLLSLLEAWDLDFWNEIGGGVESAFKYVQGIFDYSALDARLTFIPFKKKAGYFGFSLDVSAFRNVNQSKLYDPYNENYEIDATIFDAHLDFVYEHTMGRHFIFDVHAGAGVSLFNINLNYANATTVDVFNALGLCFSGGASIQFYPRRYFYMEVGCDYTFNLFNGITTQYADPGFSLGVRF